MIVRPLVLALCAMPILAAAAAAQGPAVPVRASVATPGDGAASRIRIQTSVSVFLPASFDDPAKAAEGQAQARRRIYEIAARECDMLKATLASECQLEAVTVNASRQPVPQLGGTQVTGTMTFRAVAK